MDVSDFAVDYLKFSTFTPMQRFHYVIMKKPFKIICMLVNENHGFFLKTLDVRKQIKQSWSHKD